MASLRSFKPPPTSASRVPYFHVKMRFSPAVAAAVGVAAAVDDAVVVCGVVVGWR